LANSFWAFASASFSVSPYTAPSRLPTLGKPTVDGSVRTGAGLYSTSLVSLVTEAIPDKHSEHADVLHNSAFGLSLCFGPYALASSRTVR
jgi:hypothetical protein